MEKIKNFLIKYRYFLIGLLLTLATLWPFLAAAYFSHHDDVQIIRLFEMHKCFADGQLPCRWVPDLGGLYGYPIFNYYAPLPYYIGELFYLIFGNLIISTKIMFIIPVIGSYIFMYLLGKKIWGEMGGALSAIFYSLAPYHAVVLYVRGAMGELWALMFFPAIFWSILCLRESQKIKDGLFLAIFIALLILSHNISTMLFLPITLIFILQFFWQKKDWRFLIISFSALFLSLLLSAFYWLPMITEKNLVHVETMTGGYFSYTEHFKGLRKIIFDHSWGWGASVREVPGGEKDGMSFQIGWIHLLGLTIVLLVLKKLWNKDQILVRIIIFSLMMIILSIFMINPRSEFIWTMIGPLKYVQFPWRFLMMVIFFVSFMIGGLLLNFDKKKQVLVWIIGVTLVVLTNFFYFRPEKFLDVTDKQLLSGENWDRQIKRSIFDFLPIYAAAPPAELATSRYQIICGETAVSNFHEGTNWITFQANTKTHTIIRLSQYYFPDWVVKVDDEVVKIDYSSGFITFILGVGNHYIEARLLDTPIRIIGNSLSCLGLMILLILIPTQIPRTRRWLDYYLKALNR